MVAELASVDGTIRPTAESTVPLPDDGLYRGDGAFEVIRLYGGRPFALGEHLDRIERSAAAIELAVDRAALESEVAALVAELGVVGADPVDLGPVDAQLRIVLTRAGRRLVLSEPLPERGEAVRLATVTYSPSVVLDGVKSLSYAANMQATRAAQHAGADEALLVRPGGTVLEAPTAAIFWVTANGVLRTPSLETGILDSITRAKLVDGLDIEQGVFEIGDLREAREGFLASTTREVQPVGAIDEGELACPGDRTIEAREVFRAAVERELGSDPAPDRSS